MAVVLMGTHTLAQTTLILPNPGWNNSRNINLKVDWKQSMNGTVYSYVSGTEEQALQLDFLVSEEKAEELARFFQYYSTTVNRMYYFDDSVWTFRFMKNELEFTTQFRGEFKQVSLDLLGRKLS